MFTNYGSMEAGESRFDVIAAQSFADVSSVANPEDLIKKQPELFVGDWEGPTEVVALIDQRRIAAAGVVRFCTNSTNTLEAFVVGEISDGVDLDPKFLKQAICDRVKQRKAAMTKSEDGSAHPVHTTVHWGSKPPTIDKSTTDSTVGITGYQNKLRQLRQQFLEDLYTPNGPLKF